MFSRILKRKIEDDQRPGELWVAVSIRQLGLSYMAEKLANTRIIAKIQSMGCTYSAILQPQLARSRISASVD
jgi:hypothetical protein